MTTHLVDTAVTKWCPFARTATMLPGGIATGINRNPDTNSDLPPNCLCIADKCIAWIETDQAEGRCGLVPGK